MNIQKAYEDVEKFNNIAGNLDTVDYDSVDNQISFIFEELTETITAIESKDGTELLDGACDLFVTVAGLLQKLKVAGFDVDTALERVNENNLSKFPSISGEVQFDAAFTSEINTEYQVHVIKDSVGKIRKPSNFVPVNVSDLVAPNFFTNNQQGEV